MEKLKKRNKTLDEVNNNVKLLYEMMAHFNPDSPSLSEMQTMKVGCSNAFLAYQMSV